MFQVTFGNINDKNVRGNCPFRILFSKLDHLSILGGNLNLVILLFTNLESSVMSCFKTNFLFVFPPAKIISLETG